MEAIDVLNLIAKAENSKVQFKELIVKGKQSDAYDIATEMVAFSNSEGGIILIGVKDKTGEIVGLSYEQLQKSNQLLVNAASENVKEPIIIFTETVTVSGKNILAVHIKEGTNKPYRDNKGIIWVKNGSDKRKILSNDELRRLLQSSGNISAEEEIIDNTSYNDIDVDFFKKFVEDKIGKSLDTLNLPIQQILNNMGFAANEKLSLAGLLLFGKNPQIIKPLFTIQCVSFIGNEISVKEYRDRKLHLEGKLSELYDKAMTFLLRNLRNVQVSDSFNSVGQLEIPKETLEELLVNALIHRNYFINSPIRVFIFENRIEIISPGKLPNNLNVDRIKLGTSVVRNAILFSNASYLLPYTGIGHGIPAALNAYPYIVLENDIEREIFTAVIERPTS